MNKLLIISNYWEWGFLGKRIPASLLSLVLRIACYGDNHAAILIDGVVHEMIGSNWKWIIKKFLGFKVSYLPNEGCGYITTPYDKWLKKTNRKVSVYEILVDVQEVEVDCGYGFLDLNQMYLHIVRTKWLLIGNNWNGEDGTRLWKGIFCSEYTARRLGRKDAHRLTPHDLRFIPELKLETEFKTLKGQGIITT